MPRGYETCNKLKQGSSPPLQIFFVNETQTRLDRTSVICGALGGLAALRLICYTLNVSSSLLLPFLSFPPFPFNLLEEDLA